MATHIEDLLSEKIEQIKTNQNAFDSGTVIKVKDYIIEATGLETVRFYEKVIIQGKGIGYINQIKQNSVVIAIVRQYQPIKVGDIVNSTGAPFKAIFSTEAMGRITNLFGVDLLTGNAYERFQYVDIEKENIPIMDRREVNRPLYTGIAGIDLIYPIGKGQRQLIIGDKKTGKTQIALDIISNQQNYKNEKSEKAICIYVSVGKTKKELKQIYFELLRRNVLSNTMLVAATNDEKPPVLSLIPYVGLSIADEYMKAGKDVIVIIDDLKKHAEAYREIALLSGKTPGRDGYPSDIFYTHARLLEKGCQYKNGGSITILPIMETKGGDFTDYISTNIISITDGQLVLSAKNFNSGFKPAIDYGLSVSRLGGQVQDERIKQLGAKVRRKFLSYLETKEVYEMANMDEMTEDLRNKMKEGSEIQMALQQNKFSPMNPSEILDRFIRFAND